VQWRHDVDQLIVTAINTPYHEGAAVAGGNAFVLPLGFVRTAI
jgi:hypothetical protein